jgi:hypothetical protein
MIGCFFVSAVFPLRTCIRTFSLENEKPSKLGLGLVARMPKKVMGRLAQAETRIKFKFFAGENKMYKFFEEI